MPHFSKRPVVIEARQYTESTADVVAGLRDWVNGPAGANAPLAARVEGQSPGRIVIKTLEGDMTALVGDWIIRGVAGEFYPCKPAIFAATYELVEP